MNRHLASLRALAESGLDLAGDLSCQAVLQRIIERAVELVGCRYGALVILDGGGQIAEFYTAGIDPPTQAAISHLAAWKGTLGISLREQRILRVGDLTRHPRPPSFSPRHPPMTSFLGIPVSAQGQLLGELYLAEKQADRWFSAEDEAFVGALARQAAIAIRNARLYAEAQEGARQALRQWQEYYTALMNSVDGIVWEADARTFKFSFVSQQAARILGYAVERWLTEPTFWRDHIHPDDREWAVQFCVRATTEKRDHQFEYRMMAADGRTVWLRDLVTVIVEDDQPVKLRGVMVDVTESRRAEQTREALYRESLAIQEPLELNERLALLLKTAKTVLELDRVNILLADQEGQWLQAAASIGTTDSLEAIRVPIGPEGGAIAQAYLNKQAIFWDGRGAVPEEFRLKPPYDRIEALRSRVFTNVPLVVHGRAIGVLGADRKHSRRPLEPETLKLLQLFAAQTAIAIDSARLYEGVESTNRSLLALNQVAQTVNQSLDLQEILDAVLDATLKAVGVEAGNIRLWDEREGVLTIAAHRGMSAGYVNRMRHFRPGEGVSGKVFERREVFLVEDLREYPHLNDIAQKEGVRSVASIPIRSREKVVGVMSILSHGQRRFTPAEIDLLTAIGNQIGTAIENARLYQEVRRAALELEAKVEERTCDLESLNARLEETLRVAEEASRHKSVFLANMSHELRTPLNAIIGFSELLEDQHFGSLNERQQRYVGNVHSSGRHLLALINDVLDISKVEAGKIEVQPEVFAAGPALEAAIREVRSQAIRRGVRMELEIEEGLATLVADPLRFKQILYNLLSNAVKFTDPGGGIRLSARVVHGSGFTVHGERPAQPEPSTMNHERNGDFVEIAVSDTGIGIKAEDIPKLFQPFTQLDASLARRYQGTGLGLALTKRLVELHGGQIWAESEGEGKGSTFTFTLPLRGQVAA